MRNKEFGYRVEQSHASGRRYLCNPVHTQRSEKTKRKLVYLKILL